MQLDQNLKQTIKAHKKQQMKRCAVRTETCLLTRT